MRTFVDKRGEILFNIDTLPFEIKQCFTSRNNKNVLRGLHCSPYPKYITVNSGKIFDVMVDLRSKSKTFGQYFSILLSEKNSKSIYIPEGFAHGFIALDNENIISYNCTNYRNAKSELTLKWNDSDINIKWPKIKPILSNKDNNGLSLNDFIKKVKNF